MILAAFIPLFGMFDTIHLKPSVLAKKEPQFGFKLTTKIKEDLWLKFRVYEERKNDLSPTDKYIAKCWLELNF